jgi:DNA-binding transcriptional ArsR family regulator
MIKKYRKGFMPPSAQGSRPAAASPRPSRFQPRATLRVTTLQQLKVLSDPLRVDMLEMILYEAHTVKQIATILGVPPTKLYYHMRALETAGFARVVQTQVKSGIIEKYYRRAARTFLVDPQLFMARPAPNGPQANLAKLVAYVLQATTDDVHRSFDAGLIELPATTREPARNFVLKRGLFHLHAEDIPRFVAGLNALLEEMDANHPAKGYVDYGCTVAFYPRPGPAKPKRRG